jgi:hypothetical protein
MGLTELAKPNRQPETGLTGFWRCGGVPVPTWCHVGVIRVVFVDGENSWCRSNELHGLGKKRDSAWSIFKLSLRSASPLGKIIFTAGIFSDRTGDSKNSDRHLRTFGVRLCSVKYQSGGQCGFEPKC